MKMNFLLASAFCVSLCLPFQAVGSTIDFENLANAQDETMINYQFLDEFGVTFALDADNDGFADANAFPTLEEVGRDGKDGFVNDPTRQSDAARAGYEDQLGQFFLKTTPGVGNQRGLVPSLLITYENGSAGMSGEIWDIDGNNSQGTEQWRIEALDKDRKVIEYLDSPIGTTTSDATSLNGIPYFWEFARDTNDIHAVRISFTGTKRRGTGLAFNNFNPYTVDEAAPTPEPSTIALVGIGLLSIAAYGRRKK